MLGQCQTLAPQLDLNVQVPYAGGKAGWHLLVDSTGIKFLGERVISRIFEYLVNELYIRAAILIDVQSLAVLRWQPWHRHGGSAVPRLKQDGCNRTSMKCN